MIARRTPTAGLPGVLGEWRVVGAVAITLLAWASAFVVIRGIGDSFSPGSLALGRLVIGAAGLALLLIGHRWVRLSARDWLFAALYGALWFGVYNVLLNLAEQTLDAGTTAMVVNIGPLLIALGAALLLREGMHRWLGIGLVVAFCGVLLIGAATGGETPSSGIGVIAALGAAVTYAAGVLFQKPVIGAVPPRQVTFLGAVIGAALCLPFSGALAAELTTAPPTALVGLVYLGVVPTAIAFSTWGYALSRMPAGQLGVTTYLVPPLVVLAGALFFAELPAALAVAGGVLCLAGVALSRRRATRPQAPSTAERRTVRAG